MKKKEISKLALLGMASGVIAFGQLGADEIKDPNAIDVTQLLAKSKCGAHGCGSVVAERDVKDSVANDDADDADDLDDDSDDSDEDDTDAKDVKVDETKKPLLKPTISN